MSKTVTKKSKPSKNRLNITLNPETEMVLNAIAKRHNIPKAKAAAGLLVDAIEIMEDQVWAELADKRRKKDKERKYYSHKEAWADLK